MKSFLTFISEGSRGYRQALRRYNKAGDDLQLGFTTGSGDYPFSTRLRFEDAKNKLNLTQRRRDPRIEARALKVAQHSSKHGPLRKTKPTISTASTRLDGEANKFLRATEIAQNFTNNFDDEGVKSVLDRFNLTSLKGSPRLPKKNRDRRIIDPTRLSVRRGKPLLLDQESVDG